jgi:hypothetical protein
MWTWVRIPSRTDFGALTKSGKPWGQLFYTGDPVVICLVGLNCLSLHNTHNLAQNTHTCSNNLPTNHWSPLRAATAIHWPTLLYTNTQTQKQQHTSIPHYHCCTLYTTNWVQRFCSKYRSVLVLHLIAVNYVESILTSSKNTRKVFKRIWGMRQKNIDVFY